jgi:hypothetical protein
VTDLERHRTTWSSSAPAGRDCAPRSRRRRRARDRGRLQVAARQGAHGHGRGRHRRGHGQRLRRGQLEGALPRHRCAAARCSTTGGWRSCTRRRRPDRVRELEDWGALFDRTPEGLISQRDFGGTATPGSRTSATARASSSSARCSSARSRSDRRVHGGDRHPADDSRRRQHQRGVRLPARVRPVLLWQAPSVVLATGGIGKSYKVTSNSGSTPATATRWRCRPARRSSTWSSCSSTRPGWSGRRRCAGSS